MLEARTLFVLCSYAATPPNDIGGSSLRIPGRSKLALSSEFSRFSPYTLRPRLDGLGADQARISIPWGEHEHLSIPSDTNLISRAVEQIGARLIVIDPLAAFLAS